MSYNHLIIRKIKIMFDTIINPQKGIRTFVFEKEETQQSTIVDYQIDLRNTFINLNYLLSIYCSLQHHKVSIYDPSANNFVSFKKIGADNGFVHKQYFQPKVILLRYRKNKLSHMDSDSLDSNLQADSSVEKRDGRSRERTIAEVIELVKRWRNLHLHGHKSLNRRLNLQDAAKLVGISKKSLDDYYCQLRLGQFYNFDFADKLGQKMGVLRSYVKDYKPEKDQRRRQNQKHPKNLRVIEQFELETRTLKIEPEENNSREERSQQMLNENEREYNQNQQEKFGEENQQQIQMESNPVFEQLFNLQHDFFRGFELVLDEPSDPYLQIERNFSKKDYNEDSNSFMYF